MISKKTIHIYINNILDTTIIFTFYQICVNINITNIQNNKTILSLHNEFNETLTELKNDYLINDHQILLIQKWYDKNYIKAYPVKEYTTRYGRKISMDLNLN